jgi:hypothetical protein
MLTKNHATLAAEVKAHIEADAVAQGYYWDGVKGCFIGCLTHSDDASAAPIAEKYGLPEPLVKICESIFEALPKDEGKAFFGALPDAVGRDGKNLSRVHWSFLGAELRALPPVAGPVQAAIDSVIDGMDRLARGDVWPAAADAADAAARAARHAADAAYATRAAADAAYAADAADAAYAADAAVYAAYATRAAADAADAAYAARAADARRRQRDTILKLISEAA